MMMLGVKSFSIFAVYGLLCGLKLLQAEVLVVTDKTYDQVIDGSKNVFLKVYAPWCGHCKALAEPWEALGKAFENEKEVIVAKLDATTETEVAKKLDVRGYPTLLLFKKGQTTPTPYMGSREVKDLVSFVNQQSGTFRLLDGTINELHGISQGVVDLFKKTSCVKGKAADCLSSLKAAWKSYVVPDDVESNTFLKKCHHYYDQVLTKIGSDASYLAKELTRLKELYKSSSVGSSAKEFIFARINIIKSLQPIITEKLNAAKERVEEEL